MSKIEKLIVRFKARPKDLTWDEMIKLLDHFGYKEIFGSGSRRKFMHADHRLIMLHQPHPGKILKRYQIEQVYEILNEEGLL
jgi:predicted RNA binding protein YcfA (HicA-like mRNA interferase family)